MKIRTKYQNAVKVNSFKYLWLFAFGVLLFFQGLAQQEADFRWGDSYFFQLNTGESMEFQETEIELLKVQNHCNTIRIGIDTVTLKVSRRSLPVVAGGTRVFVANNKNVQALAANKEVYGLLKKDVMLCLSDFSAPLLDPAQFIFPISFNDGFLWSVEEDNHLYSHPIAENSLPEVSSGIGIDLHDARGIERHWILAMENSTVVWTKDKNIGKLGKEASVLLQSDSNPTIFYLYEHLYNRKTDVKKGDKLMRGEAIGTIWGDEKWGHLHLSVLKSDTIPSYENRNANAVNYFSHLYELYFKQTFNYSKRFSKGIIHFGQPSNLHGNKKNLIAFEEYVGKGWKMGNWNTMERVSSVDKDSEGNARLRKKLWEKGGKAIVNPRNYYEYELNVQNGVYRIRAKMGDLLLPSWQKVEFEGIEAATYSLEAGEQKWTSEKVVRVKDRKLTVRIYIDETNRKVAGISQIVFQKSY